MLSGLPKNKINYINKLQNIYETEYVTQYIVSKLSIFSGNMKYFHYQNLYIFKFINIIFFCIWENDNGFFDF